MTRVKISVCELEFEEGGDTIWVHSPAGATVLRIKSMKGIVTSTCESSPVSHFDLVVEGPIEVCLAGDAEKDE